MNQPVGLIEKMTLCQNVYNAIMKQKSYAEKQNEFIKECPKDFAIIETVRKIRNGE